MYINHVSLCGRLAADPILTPSKTGDDAKDRCWFRVAVQRPGSDSADFISVTAWGARARAVAQYCKKGKEVLVEGSIRTNSVQAEDGSYTNYFEVSASNVSFGADPKSKGVDTPAPAQAPSAPQAQPAQMAQLLQLLQGALGATASSGGEEAPF